MDLFYVVLFGTLVFVAVVLHMSGTDSSSSTAGSSGDAAPGGACVEGGSVSGAGSSGGASGGGNGAGGSGSGGVVTEAESKRFRLFRNNYLIVFCMMMGEWGFRGCLGSNRGPRKPNPWAHRLYQ